MKRTIRWIFIVAAAIATTLVAPALQAQGFGEFGGYKETHATITIKAEGSVSASIELVSTRTAAAQMVKMMKRFGDGDMDTGMAATPVDTNSLTDAELKSQYEEMIKKQYEREDSPSETKVTVQVDKDNVHTSRSRDFATLEDWLREGGSTWAEGGLAPGTLRLETTNNQLQLTFTAVAGMGRYARQMRQSWKLTGAKTDLKLVLPGKVLTSSFSATEGNTTTFAVDAQKDESLDAALKFYTEPAVVTAELGGLKLDHPLDSKSLLIRGRRNRNEAGDDLPITDAGPGFVAEAMAITTTTLHLFPEGAKQSEDNMLGGPETNSTLVMAKLFPPKGRTMQSVSQVRVLKATDDKGRSLASAAAEDSDRSENFQSFSYVGNGQRANSAQLQLRFQLPEPDASAIDEITAEAVALTAGSWKEMTLTNLEQSVSNEVDLAAIMPGAKLFITKYSATNNQTRIQAELRGPAAVSQLDLQARTPGANQSSTSSNDRGTRTKNNQTVRTILIQSFSFSEENASQPPMVLLIRSPQDQRRERVNLKLKGLDLM